MSPNHLELSHPNGGATPKALVKEDTYMKTPPVDPALVEWLEKRYPNQVPRIEDSDREIGAKIGEQRVIDALRGIVQKIRRENL